MALKVVKKIGFSGNRDAVTSFATAVSATIYICEKASAIDGFPPYYFRHSHALNFIFLPWTWKRSACS